MAEPTTATGPSLGRDALSGRLQKALGDLEGRDGGAASWRRAWLLTAAGRYGEALDACAEAMDGSPLLQASSRMVEAMVYRQVALHARAEDADEEALDVLQSSSTRSPSVRAAIRVGMVADAVGLGLDDATMGRRLKIAVAAVASAGSWRQRVRLTWVRGEVAMVRGRYALAAKDFSAGARIAADQGAKRHEAKCLIFLAAASAALDQRSEAIRLATRGLHLAARCGAPPLMWPAELILAEVDPDGAADHLSRARDVAGGLLQTLPEPLRAEALQRAPARWLIGESREEHARLLPVAELPTDA